MKIDILNMTKEQLLVLQPFAQDVKDEQSIDRLIKDYDNVKSFSEEKNNYLTPSEIAYTGMKLYIETKTYCYIGKIKDCYKNYLKLEKCFKFNNDEDASTCMEALKDDQIHNEKDADINDTKFITYSHIISFSKWNHRLIGEKSKNNP